MKNLEKYLNEIETQKVHSPRCYTYWHLMKNGNCKGVGCDECALKTFKWLNEEYKEQIQLSHDEYVILKNVDSKFNYIGRSGNGVVAIYVEKPFKMHGTWDSYGDLVSFRFLYNHLFQFAKWEDDEPYEISKLIADYEREHEDEKNNY